MYVGTLSVQPAIGYVDPFTLTSMEVGTSRHKYLR
jgi:hypothetical protein